MLEQLNEPQREAAEHREGPLLILAGAGSGKTRVVTVRIAHLIAEREVDPEAILAVTFTNKAADEMQERVDELLDREGAKATASRAYISTFHALGAQLFRWHARMVGRDRNFTILDEDDQLAAVSEVGERLGLDLDHSEKKRLRRHVEGMKNRGVSPEEAHERTESRNDERDADFYERYQEYLREANVADFGDLLLGPLQMFRTDPDLAESYSRQWRYLMVDEFQDTNPAQYELLEHLTATHSNLAVVGDDDQAIYRWRDATVENILGFEEDFPDVRVVKLEQNYRSTPQILDAANDVIEENPRRREKQLWTDRGGGESPTVFTAETGREEAEYVADEIQTLVRGGDAYSDFAVFYRTNAQSRLFEEQFRASGVPYRVVGGTSFYGRAEIKDVLAYLQLALNPDDDVSFLRVVGTPTRGVGERTVEKLRRATGVEGLDSLFDAARYSAELDERVGTGLDRLQPEPRGAGEAEALEVLGEIGGRPKGGLKDFCELVVDLREGLVEGRGLADLVEHLIDRVNYLEWIEDRDPERADDKTRNVVELTEAMRDFAREPDREDEVPVEGTSESEDLIASSEGGRRLRAFLERTTLVRDSVEAEESGAVTLMTVHGAKGLEFDTVFLAGMEDELFPNLRDEEPAELYEERRLAYVAITRAQNQLYITNARRRRLYGSTRRTRPSRFLLDIDEQRLQRDPRSCVGEIDYGRDRSRWRSPGAPDSSPPDGDFGVFGEESEPQRYFDQSPDRQHSEPDAAGSEMAENEELDIAQVAPEESSPGEEPVREENRPGETTDHELVGVTVTHNRFGIGRVVAVSDGGAKTRLTVRFPEAGEQSVYRRFVKVVG